METFSQYIQWHAVFATLKLYLVSSIPRPCSRGWYHWRSKVGADNRSNCRETGASAQIMLVRLAKWSWLKAWAMKIARHPRNEEGDRGAGAPVGGDHAPHLG